MRCYLILIRSGFVDEVIYVCAYSLSETLVWILCALWCIHFLAYLWRVRNPLVIFKNLNVGVEGVVLWQKAVQRIFCAFVS